LIGISEQRRGPPIVEVEEASQDLSPHHQHVLGVAGLHRGRSECKRGNRAAARGADVEGRGVRRAEFVRDDRSGARRDLVCGERGDEQHVDLDRVQAGVLQRHPPGARRQVTHPHTGRGTAPLADPGAPLDPLNAHAKPCCDLCICDPALGKRGPEPRDARHPNDRPWMAAGKIARQQDMLR
jgi:hypothetical protein